MRHVLRILTLWLWIRASFEWDVASLPKQGTTHSDSQRPITIHNNPTYNDQNNPQQPKTKKSTATHYKRKQSKSTQDKIKNGTQRLKRVQNIQQQATITQ